MNSHKRIICANALDFLDQTPIVKAMFADPPDNLGLKYDQYKDRLPPECYRDWLELLILKSLVKCSVLWLSVHHSHLLTVCSIAERTLRQRHPAHSASLFFWLHSFSQYDDRDCAQSHRPILRITSPMCRLYPDAIRIVSERMLIGDRRAAGPRVPDNIWEYPRVCGNSAERRAWHPTQHPEALIQRMQLLSCSAGETWVDLFAGSGTSFRSRGAGGPIIGVEISRSYCDRIAEEHGLSVEMA